MSLLLYNGIVTEKGGSHWVNKQRLTQQVDPQNYLGAITDQIDIDTDNKIHKNQRQP